MIGHECRLSRTNSGGVVWICQCGAIGNTVPLIAWDTAQGARGARRLALTESIARARHAEHCADEREDIAARSARALDDHAKVISLANQTLLRRGRWGNA